MKNTELVDPAVSELEGVVLGIVRVRGPCTAYAVRKELASSPSSHWGASAGSIYPLVRRLEAMGLVEHLPDPEDGRGRRRVTLTERGREALRRWMLRGGSPEVTADISDALRTRAFFLETLSPSDRRRFAAEALSSAEEFLVVAREYAESQPMNDTLAGLAALGGVYSAEARVRWLREIHRALGLEPD